MTSRSLIHHVIAGESSPSADGATMTTVDPTTRQPWADVDLGSPVDVGRAVDAARTAFDDGPWPRMSQDDRSALLHKLADEVLNNAADLALLDTTDMGRPLALTTSRDVPRSAANLRFFADDARLAIDESFPRHAHHVYSRYEPVGVVAAISPWNFPLMQATWKVAPALAHGNTVVLKPAEQSPASATRLAELAIRAGLPPGVLNVVQGVGAGGAGAALVAHPNVDLITFTGETSTAESIMRSAADGVRGVSFELGGKGASIIFADADLDRSVQIAADAAFSNSGQVCLAGSRVFVERTVYDDVVERLAKVAAAMRVGNPLESGTQIGPLASQEHHAKVTSHVRAALDGGATMVTGGAKEGWWVAPTVLVDVSATMPIYCQEVFGPVVTVHPFDCEDEAVAAANNTPYGLSAMVFTAKLGRAHRVAAQLRSGNIWINCFNIRELRSPFGGFGRSGIGREGGRHSREFFTEAKTVVIDLEEDK